MGEVTDLCHDEAVQVDPDRLAQLLAELGPARTEGVLGRAMAEMQAHLVEAERMYRHGKAVLVRRHARSLSRLAAQVGMPVLARVACDVDTCAARGDMVALAATLARLLRIVDRSLGAMRRARGMSG